MTYDFDLFVIGGGSGGVRAARLAAQKGLRVGMAEGDRMGGTCVIRGCVPKKLMLFASDFSMTFELAREFGWGFSESILDWQRFKEKLSSELERLERVYQGIMENNKVRLFKDWAALDGENHIVLNSGMRFSAERILIATGGKPFVPEFQGNAHAITSNDVFTIEKLPKSIVIKGGGYIACEFASILNQMGVQVTQVYRGGLVLRGYDQEIRQILSGQMIARGVDLHYNTNIARMELEASGKKKVILDDGETLAVDEVLVATGRIANIENLNLGATGVKVEKGAIKVDQFSQTNIPSIYAIGDVTGRAALTPVAIREAVNFIKTVYDNEPNSVNYDLIPTAVFTRPELGVIGLDEEKAGLLGFDIEIYSTRFRPMLAAFADLEDVMFMKLIVDRASDKVLGVHLAGMGAGEMIQLVAVAVTMGATKSQFDETIAVHPTTSEELVTMTSARK